MGRDFHAVVDKHTERGTAWKYIFGRFDVCIVSPQPQLAELPGFDEPQPVYLIDLDLLTSQEMNRLVYYLSGKFSQPPEQVRQEIKKHGVPILADECTVVIENPLRWFD